MGLACDRRRCEDHLPAQAQLETEDGWYPSGNCKRFEKLGQNKPNQAYFITCTRDCREWRDANAKIFCLPKSMHKASASSSKSRAAASPSNLATTPTKRRRSSVGVGSPSQASGSARKDSNHDHNSPLWGVVFKAPRTGLDLKVESLELDNPITNKRISQLFQAQPTS